MSEDLEKLAKATFLKDLRKYNAPNPERLSERKKKWTAIRNGQIPDDYTNYFLSVTGLRTDHYPNKERKLKRGKNE